MYLSSHIDACLEVRLIPTHQGAVGGDLLHASSHQKTAATRFGCEEVTQKREAIVPKRVWKKKKKKKKKKKSDLLLKCSIFVWLSRLRLR